MIETDRSHLVALEGSSATGRGRRKQREIWTRVSCRDRSVHSHKEMFVTFLPEQVIRSLLYLQLPTTLRGISESENRCRVHLHSHPTK